MSRKLNFIPFIPDYDFIKNQMNEDLKYRLESRWDRTSLGRPLYKRINLQIVMTHECPYNCPFCLERQHPMKGKFNADAQIEALKSVLQEHPNARLTITGGEPGLYPEHVRRLVNVYHEKSNNTFVSINTSGYNTQINGMAHINLSVNDYVKPDPLDFPGCTLQTVLDDEQMTLENIRRIMIKNKDASSFSFRFLCGLEKESYSVAIWNEIQEDQDFEIGTFRIGDFFVYCTFDWMGRHGRVVLGDMNQQIKNDYKDGYSNIIIHPDGRIKTNWK